MNNDVIIRQRYIPGKGDRARVTRLFQVGRRLYVEVTHPKTAKERTIELAIDRALRKNGHLRRR